ncbi:MAG: 5-formyltetrahydrofolate cyclo-ligase [Verrucomicrobiae bacterium]|nr:5-formyltetrahydrofolate cyclo-ligase [Verrucomicrobiae bacterium]
MASKHASKTELRAKHFAALRRWPATKRAAASARIREALRTWLRENRHSTVAAFVHLPSEPDLDALIFSDGATLGTETWFLPRVEAEGLAFFDCAGKIARLAPGAFGIREPDPGRCLRADPSLATVILIPGVGFDPETGARLGRGKGHYDRFLAGLELRPGRRPFRIGVCFELQLGPIPSEPHDRPMDAIVTEAGFHFPTQQG